MIGRLTVPRTSTAYLCGMNTLPSPALALIHQSVDLEVSISVICNEFHVLSFIRHFVMFLQMLPAVFVLFPMLCASMNTFNLSTWSPSLSDSSGACLAALAGKFDPTSFEAFWHPERCFQLILCSGGIQHAQCVCKGPGAIRLTHMHPHAPKCGYLTRL